MKGGTGLELECRVVRGGGRSSMRKRRSAGEGRRTVREAAVHEHAGATNDEQAASIVENSDSADAEPVEATHAKPDRAYGEKQGAKELPAQEAQAGEKQRAGGKGRSDEYDRRLAKGLLGFFSNPWNQEGWNGPTLAHMAKTLLEMIDKGVVEVPEDHPGLQAARDYARLWPDVKKLGLQDYIMPWHQEMLEELQRRTEHARAEEAGPRGAQQEQVQEDRAKEGEEGEERGRRGGR